MIPRRNQMEMKYLLKILKLAKKYWQLIIMIKLYQQKSLLFYIMKRIYQVNLMKMKNVFLKLIEIFLLALFYTFTTDSGHQLSLTPEHLVYIGNQKYIQARYIDSNEHQLFIAGKNGQLESSRILSVDVQIKHGYATPITQHGTLLVNNVSSSCYASIYHHSIGHLAMAPLRWAHQAKQIFGLINTSEKNENGIHWYPKALNNLVHTFVPFHGLFTSTTGKI